jgi:NAD(P)-dependent dehydrogenase (short-subunit alcohol dehydrogenase family)
MANYLITGCSRGIGLTLATQLAALPPSSVGSIFATARTLTPSLQTLINRSSGRAIFVKLETTDESSINDAVKHVRNVLSTNGSNGGLDALINNAGIMPITPGGVQEMCDLDEVLQANVTSVQMVTRAFLPLLRKGRQKKVLNM